MAKQIQTWYIEPINDTTNQIVSEYLANKGIRYSAGTEICEDGKEHNLWECPLDFIKTIRKSQTNLNLTFEIWGKEGNGKIRKKTFLFKPKNKYLKKKKTTAH